jgi:hypothetical protein
MESSEVGVICHTFTRDPYSFTRDPPIVQGKVGVGITKMSKRLEGGDWNQSDVEGIRLSNSNRFNVH